MASIVLVLSFISIKHKSTRLTDDGLLQILTIYAVLTAVASMCSPFGQAGFNPALACGYISFAVSQYAYPNYPNSYTDEQFNDYYGFDPSAKQVNHYLWVYMIAPLAGGAIAGILHLIHQKCANGKGKDGDADISVD